jgi:hypothetical protein
MSQTGYAPPRSGGGALSFLSLFTSLGTLLCCALPSFLVLLKSSCPLSHTKEISSAGLKCDDTADHLTRGVGGRSPSG